MKVSESLLDKEFDHFFDLIITYSIDEQKYVKKAVNWALRNIGKRNKNLNQKAIKVTRELKNNSHKTTRWIGGSCIKRIN